MIRTIGGTTIEHDGTIDHGLDYLDHHWNDQYVLDGFAAAKDPDIRKFDFRFPEMKGIYVLRYISEHHYSLSWAN